MRGNEAWKLIQDTIFDTIGCTEPVAVALAGARAAELLPQAPETMAVRLSTKVFKNAMAVGIPGSNRKGIRYALALGLCKGDPSLGLRLFAEVKEEDSQAALSLMERLPMEVSVAEDKDGVYIHIEAIGGKHKAEILVEGAHDRVVSAKLDGREQGKDAIEHDRDDTGGSEIAFLLEELRELDILQIIELVEDIPEKQCAELADGLEINYRVALSGRENRSGMGLGAALFDMIRDGSLGDGIVERVKAYAAAAADARMSGAMVPVKGCGGSGNHGITFFLSLGLALRYLEAQRQRSLGRSLALGLLLVQYIKAYTGLLTPICGLSVCACAAAAAGIVYGLGGNAGEILSAVQLVDGNITGMLCDGAKHGCSLKVATASQTAVESALAAVKGLRIPASDGIVGTSLKESLTHIRRLQDEGMEGADRTVLAVLLEKEKSGIVSC